MWLSHQPPIKTSSTQLQMSNTSNHVVYIIALSNKCHSRKDNNIVEVNKLFFYINATSKWIVFRVVICRFSIQSIPYTFILPTVPKDFVWKITWL